MMEQVVAGVHLRLQAIDQLLGQLRREHAQACERAAELEEELARARGVYRTHPRVKAEIARLRSALAEAQRAAEEAAMAAAEQLRQLARQCEQEVGEAEAARLRWQTEARQLSERLQRLRGLAPALVAALAELSRAVWPTGRSEGWPEHNPTAAAAAQLVRGEQDGDGGGVNEDDGYFACQDGHRVLLGAVSHAVEDERRAHALALRSLTQERDKGLEALTS
jgi:HPt (histidine-containing phosphotransfer) domain-containing protein